MSFTSADRHSAIRFAIDTMKKCKNGDSTSNRKTFGDVTVEVDYVYQFHGMRVGFYNDPLKQYTTCTFNIELNPEVGAGTMLEMIEEWQTDKDVKVDHWNNYGEKTLSFKVLTPEVHLEFRVKPHTTPFEDIEDLLSEYIKIEKDYEQARATIKVTYTSAASSYGKPMQDDLSSLATQLPGVNNIVKNPVTGDDAKLFNVIIHLNDTARWTREAIADWIETLDEVPVFKTPEEEETNGEELPSLTVVAAIKRFLPRTNQSFV